MNWSIRTSLEGDRDSIIAVVSEAFMNGGRDGSVEVAIVEDTWSLEAPDSDLDLVAVGGDVILGHVLGATGHLGDNPIVGIAPLSVTPTRHNEGIGTALMAELLRRAEH